MPNFLLSFLVAGFFIGLGIYRPKGAFLALAALIPLSHPGIQLAIIGYEPESLTPLLITIATGTLFIALWFKGIRLLASAVYDTGHVVLPYFMFLGTAVAVNYFHNGFTYSVIILDNYVGPLCLFLIAFAFLTSIPGIDSTICRIILPIIVVGVLYSCYEYITGSNPVMHRYLMTVQPPLILNVPGERASSFFGHFLFTSSIFLFGMALAFASVRNTWALFYGIVFYAGIFLTQSRAALALGAALYIYGAVRILVKSEKKFDRRLALAAIFLVLMPTLVLLMLWLPRISAYADIAERFQTAPIYHRIEGLVSMEASSWLGRGIGEGGDVARRLGNINGLENPWAYLMHDFGIIATLLYALAILGVFMSKNCAIGTRYRLLTFSGVMDLKVFLFFQLLMFSTFNSFGTRGSVNYIVWFLAALVAASSRIKSQTGRAIVE